ncbi:hypothetical protein RQP53_16360 [Paucibacter sp. APW11]|uniref:Uncharacterized protein n=1 Tax=Roseateles aquae TaxID=3077235 RepID=A0ABU3PE41_9BURK|nr:hypothetical protein [Paucibacter sp. APW11]MDT9000850.1 hypothetical protein [Paucibacter sp. APW11]
MRRRIGILSAILALSVSAFGAGGETLRTPVYEDAFVWHLSRQLAAKLIAYQQMIGVKLDDEQRGRFGMDYEFLYHHYLLRCDGPLPKLEGVVSKLPPLRSATLADGSIDFDALREQDKDFDTAMTAPAWTLIHSWAAEQMDSLMRSFAAGNLAPIPDCVAPEFLIRNPTYKLGKD